jgi:hypothetical protein
MDLSVTAGEHRLSLTAQQADLLERIQAFSLDQAGVRLAFSHRLAKDNGWPLAYAQRVIAEYKKFAFLAVIAGHPVTPSDQVDQAWHLHLTYTRSYWDEFCGQVLQMPLHHEPTQGGRTENQKFDSWYSKTLESYQHFFGEAPPADIWPAPEVRFGRDLHFIRINSRSNWVVPKLAITRGAAASAIMLLSLGLTGCYIDTHGDGGELSGLGSPLILALSLAAGGGLVSMLIGFMKNIKNPAQYPPDYGDGGSGGCSSSHGGDSGGCGVGGCGGCGGGCGG